MFVYGCPHAHFSAQNVIPAAKGLSIKTIKTKDEVWHCEVAWYLGINLFHC